MQYKEEKNHFFCKKFAYFKKKLYLCTLICENDNKIRV